MPATTSTDLPRAAPDQDPAMVPKPSAQLVATLRAAHQLLDAPLVLDDPLALSILGPRAEAELRADPARYCDPFHTALRGTLVVRSRLAEDCWRQAQSDGVRQHVILGAGLDTGAYRAGNAPGSRLFEVDLPSTQHWKRACLRAAGIAEPPALRYVALDFEQTTLAQALREGGWRDDQATFFSWLGVTVYLQPEDVERTLGMIGACAPGSGVVFDYVQVPERLTAVERLVTEAMAARLAEQGEPWRCRFDPAALEPLLHRLGYARVEQHTPEQLTERYLAGRGDGLRLGGASRLVHAIV